MYDAIVVGGGIVGTSVAYHLARDGAETLLVDRRDAGRATDAGAGILSPATSSRSDSDPWFAFAVDAVDYYPALVEALEAEQDGPVGYDACGLLKVAASADELDAFERSADRVAERAERVGRPAPESFDDVPASRARELFPPLAEPERARYYEDAARVDGRTVTAAMRRAGEARGLTVAGRSADRIEIEDDAVAAVVATGERYETRNVVVAGGAWSPAFADQLGVRLPVEPQRGQIAHLDLGETATGDWPIVSAFRGHYVVPWSDGRVAVGATRETGSGFDPRTTAGGVREVLDEALRVAPGLADAELAEVRVGLRPASADGLPVLGRVPGVDGAYLATGMGATGLQLGPYSGKLVAEMVRGQEPETDVSKFGIGRFA